MSKWECPHCGGAFDSHAPSGECPGSQELTAGARGMLVEISKDFSRERMEHPEFMDSDIWRILSDHYRQKGRTALSVYTEMVAKREGARGNPGERKYSMEDFTEGRVKCAYCGSPAIGTLGIHGPPVCDTHASAKKRGNPGRARYEVVVGNIGSIPCHTIGAADRAFKEYVAQSEAGYGRAGGEDVTLLKDGEIVKEFVGKLQRGNPPRAKHRPRDPFEVAKEKAYEMGSRAGANAAEWMIQDAWGGRVTRGGVAEASAKAFLKGYEEGDPAIMDLYQPPNLSGEFSGDMTPQKLWAELGVEDTDDMELCSSWEEGATDSFYHTLGKSARSLLGLENPRRTKEGVLACPKCGEGALGPMGPRSGPKVTWVCPKGHEWTTTIPRGNPRVPPYKSGQDVHYEGMLDRTHVRARPGAKLQVMGGGKRFSDPLKKLGEGKVVVIKQIKDTRTNPPGMTLIGRKATMIEFYSSNGKVVHRHSKAMGSAYGLSNGTAFIKGFFGDLPSAVLTSFHVTAIEYLDEAKAQREGLSPANKPWRHDFGGINVRAMRVKGGILLKGDKPVWEMR